MAKQYGLSYPKKGHQIGQVTANKLSVFGDDSDNEEEPKRPTGIPKGLKKQDKISQEKAIADDPTVYQYDEVYDDIEKKRSESKLARKDLDKKPKYINKLLAAAEKRKRENDRRIERQVQKEREEEGDLFRDKESFITPSYKKKLEEMKELEEQEKREEYLESIGDVTKQGNLDGFYRHLYDQKVNFEDNESKTKEQEVKEEISEDEIKEEQKSDSEEEINVNEQEKNANEDDKVTSEAEDIEKATKSVERKRKYRSRKDSEENSNSEEEPDIKKEHLPSNIDADSDFSINSSDSENENDSKKKSKDDTEKLENTNLTKEINDKVEDKVEDKPVESTEVKKEDIMVKPKKPKTDIWKKRTVGDKFDEAVKRYFERKALREMGQ